MNAEEKKVAATAFIASLEGREMMAGGTGAATIGEAFDLEAALEAAFAAVDKYRSDIAISRLKSDDLIIFDP